MSINSQKVPDTFSSPGINGGGGGIFNYDYGTLTITASTFSGNSAVAGNGVTGEFAGEAYGGAIYNAGPASISGSQFDHNQAIGGSNGNSGPGQQ